MEAAREVEKWENIAPRGFYPKRKRKEANDLFFPSSITAISALIRQAKNVKKNPVKKGIFGYENLRNICEIGLVQIQPRSKTHGGLSRCDDFDARKESFSAP